MAFCKQCGTKLDDGIKYCINCGAAIDGITNDEQNPYAPPQHESVPISERRRYIDYDVLQPNSALRACSRKQLQGVWGQMALACFIYYIIILLASLIFSEANPISYNITNTIMTIAISLIAGPFALGFAGYFLKRVRDEEIALRNIFDGFKRFMPGVLVMCLMYLFIILWSLLLIIPGIIKGFGYSMAFLIMYDNPDIKPREAIKQSQIMMKGYKGKLFGLYFSFFGWMLLGIFTMGIGYLWLYPYMQLSVTNFYENLKEIQRNAQE